MVEHEQLLDGYIEAIARSGCVREAIKKLWLKDYTKLHKKKSEKDEKIIYEKVKKYVTEIGFPDKGLNKEDIIREMTNILLEKVTKPVIEQGETTHNVFLEFSQQYEVLEVQGTTTTMQAEELSERDLKKVYIQTTAKEKEKKNE
jgi:hypothetical protein